MNPAPKPIQDIVIAIKGAGEMASAIAWRLHVANFRRIFMMETANPMAVRRQVAFCEAIHDGRQQVEGVTAVALDRIDQVEKAWAEGCIAVLVDPSWRALEKLTPDVCVDAILAKRNLGTTITDAPTVIGLGPGFVAGKDVHMVVETQRGHDLGRILTAGSAAPNTGIPGNIGGQAKKRVLRAPADGRFETTVAIFDQVARGTKVGRVGREPILAEVDGVVRGLIRPGSDVIRGMKLGDIDPRGDPGYCSTISDKARAIAGTVIEAILRVHLPPAGWKPPPAVDRHGLDTPDTTTLIQGVFEGDIRSISRAINIIETEGPESMPLIDGIFPHAGKAHRIGVTGPPGAGKSTFTAQLVKRLRAAGQTVGIVAVDPSSPFTGGAFFGDRLRMKAISGDTGVFIRSMATRGNPGGLSRRAADVADVLDAAGKDVIILETAGVGQVELDIMSAADTVIVLTVPDAGDMIQGMKCGIMEIGDIYVVNKADLPGAGPMKDDIEAVLHLKDFQDRWSPVVRTTEARQGRGLTQIMQDIGTHSSYLRRKGILAEKRMTRAAARVRALVDHRRVRSFWTDERVAAINEALHADGGRSSPSAVAARILGE